MGSGMIRRFGRPDMQEVYGMLSECSLLKIAHWSNRKITVASKARKTLFFAFRVSPSH